MWSKVKRKYEEGNLALVKTLTQYKKLCLNSSHLPKKILKTTKWGKKSFFCFF